jgi:Fic family protein
MSIGDRAQDDTVPRGKIDTSQASFESIRGTQRAKDADRILEYLVLVPTGLTCDEVESGLGLSHQTASARFNDLMRWGFTERLGEKRATRSGRKARVWTLTGPGGRVARRDVKTTD